MTKISFVCFLFSKNKIKVLAQSGRGRRNSLGFEKMFHLSLVFILKMAECVTRPLLNDGFSRLTNCKFLSSHLRYLETNLGLDLFIFS